MTLETFLTILTRFVYVFLAVITLGQWLRYRDRTRFDVALVFISLALTIIIQGIEKVIGLEISWLTRVGTLALIAHPYFLLRVAHYFHPVNTLVRRGALLGLGFSWLALIFTAATLPTYLTLILITYFAFVEIYATVVFVRGMFTASGITKHRLRLASAGSGLIAVLFFVAGILVTLPAESRPLFNPLFQALALLAGLSYYFGFAPPRWLRRTWQLGELHQFIQDSSNRLTRGRTVIFDELCHAALYTVGGTAGFIARYHADNGHLITETSSEPTSKPMNLKLESGNLAQVWRERKARVVHLPDQIEPELDRWAGQYNAKALFIVPILSPLNPWGLLIVAVRHIPLFVQDDLDVLTLLSQQSAIPLDYTRLIEQLETSNLSLEQRFTKAFHASPAALVITRLSDSQVIDVNDSWLRLFGFRREEVIGHPSTELNINRDQVERAEIFRRLGEQGFIRNYEMTSYTKSGQAIRIMFSTEQIEIDSEPHALGTVIDITDRKNAEDTIRRLNIELEERVMERTHELEELNLELGDSKKEIQSILDSMSTLNAKVALDGTLLFVNKIATEAAGLSHDELMKTNFLEGQWWAFDTEVQSRVKAAFERARSGKTISYEEKIFVFGQIQTISFSLTPMLGEDGRVEYILAEGRDITRLKQAEDRFRGLLESAPDGMVVVDQAGIIQLVNSQTEKMFGYDRAEIVGQPVEVLVPKRLRKRHTKHRDGYYVEHPSRPMGIGLDLFGLRKNGTEFPVEISLSPLKASDGLLVSAAIRDVTYRKQIEADIQQLNEDLKQRAAQLEAANKELESFSYSVSHDLRAPLRSIDGFSHAVLEDYGEQLPTDAREYLERVRAAAQRMAVLIDDLLNLSRVTRAALHPRFINLSAMVKEIIETLKETQPERQADFSISPDLMVEADPHLIHIVLENLLSNAWKFTSKRDLTMIEFGQQNHVKERTFFIRDNGVGFDMAYANKLFGVFQRLHAMSEFPGTGVGLATVQRIIAIHGGRIWADSVEGKGTTFYFTL